jgi:AmmeMemoRadiSam system protein A
VTIENSVNRNSIPEFRIKSDKLNEKRGAFVTINKFGQLRGCIGYTQPIYPLFQTIQQVAKAAAFEDPRFSPVTPNELKNLKLEISVLTLPKKIESVDEIEVGKHGLIIKQNYFQGLLLPQVASDYGWNRTTFLEQTCRKAGLKKSAWKDKKTEIFIFSAEVFGEH